MKKEQWFKKYMKEIFWYALGITTMLGIYTLSWMIETVIKFK